MSLNSLSFLAFLGVVTLVYYIVPKSFQWRILLLASYGFYLLAGVETVLYILVTTSTTFLAALWMQKMRVQGQKTIADMGDDVSRDEKRQAKKAVSDRIRKVQVAAVLLNLGILACLKYLSFFFESFNSVFALFRWDISLPAINLLVPLGLSYYTFNSIGYVVDVGRGKIEAERNLGKYALFVSFFPSIVQGPLFRFGDVGKQLMEPHTFHYDNITYGAQLILWGFFKKMIIADRIAAITATVFAPGYADYSGSHIFFGVLAYSFQIYGDFSGGTDITRGAAQMLGIDLPVNFARPFFATSMADFWRRWHMSLGAWMREFVFYPVMLCGPVTNLSKKMRQKYGAYAGKMVPSVAAPFVVFFLIGIWHGLSWQYIINGLYNAVIISSSVALTPVYKKMIEKTHVDVESFSFRLFQMIRTFGLLCISRIIVKAPSVGDALKMIKALFTSVDPGFLLGLDGTIYSMGVSKNEMIVLVVAVLVLLVIGILQEMGIEIRKSIARQNIVFRWTIWLLLFCAVLIFGSYGLGYDARSFIYGNF